MKRTVKDFPPEYMSVWQLAREGKLMLQIPTKGAATNKRQDLYVFRKRLNEEAPPLAAPFFEVDLIVEEENGFGIFRSGVLDWKQQVRAAVAGGADPAVVGRIVETVPSQRVENLIAAEPVIPAQDAMADKLADLGFGVEPKDT